MEIIAHLLQRDPGMPFVHLNREDVLYPLDLSECTIEGEYD